MNDSHLVTMTTRDGDVIAFPCGEDESVVAAAARQNLTLPGTCREGGCGSCRATCADGDYHLASHSLSALSATDRERREVLLCRTFPRGPLSIAAPFERAHILEGASPRRSAEITEIDVVASKTVRLLLTLHPDADDCRNAEFEPGQQMELILPDSGVKRAYSLANVPNWSGHLEFFIRLQPGGQFSSWLESHARPGTRLDVQGPGGGFTLQERGLRPRWFVAGGTGLSPILSMLRRMAEFQHPQEVRLYFGATRSDELFGQSALEQLRAELPRLTIEYCLWRAEDGWSGFTGTPAQAVARDLALGGTPDIYVCGPPALIDATAEVARSHGLPESQIICERFLPS